MSQQTELMPPGPATRGERWRRVGMVLVGVLALASYIALVSVNLLRAREREVDATRRTLEGLAKVLESHASATVDKIDTVLLASRLLLERSAAERPEPAAINRALGAHLALIGESQSLRVADATGHFIYDASGRLYSATITDRDYFLRNRADPSGPLVISEPLFARITNNWVITLSRRLDGPDGQFAGLVQAAVRAEYFQEFYDSLQLGADHIVTLVDHQLRLVARVPAVPAQLGLPLNSPSLRAMLASGAREKIYTAASGVDGVERLFAARQVGDYPLYVVVGRRTADYLAGWQRQLAWSVAGMLLLSLVMAGWILGWLRTYDAALALARRMTAAYEATVAQIRHLAEHDQLTDLPNRSLLGTRMATALAEAVGSEAQLALLFLDLDHFKDVNDTLGHSVGDQLLVQVAERLRAVLDGRDVVSRQGGDEFAILLRGYDTPVQIAAIAQRLLDALGPPFQVAGHELSVSASIGIGTYPQDGADIGSLLKSADTAMYQAKAAGGGAYQFFTEAMHARIRERVALGNSLRRALAQGEFVLHYQPQVDGVTGQLLGVEALIRWQHPERGEVAPGGFIPVAEESGLINGIGDWVLTEACRQARHWLECGYPPLTIAVNLSAVQLRQRNLSAKVTAILAASGLPPGQLELEITESALIRDTERIVRTLQQLKGAGIKLSVDDFGTGYSSLGYLKRLPVDKIKIDQSFIRDLPASDDDAAITRAIIGIATTLRKELIAEGVESPAQRDFLLQHGCRVMQGFYFSRPLPVAALEARLAARTPLPG